jgi:hypothetical protein
VKDNTHMRITTPIIAAALLTAAPAIAQNEPAPTNASDINAIAATDANLAAPDANAAAPANVEVAPLPVDNSIAPAPVEEKHGFPWGVLGLLGLLGFLPRARKRG